MKQLQYIQQIIPYINDAFREFYDAMLSDSKLSIFFESQAQIQNLINIQQKYFLDSLELSLEEIERVYTRLGEYHYDMRIPYVDFLKGSQMLKEYFLVHTTKSQDSKEIMRDIFEYFNYMKSFTAKGYLNRMIKEDKLDIENFFNYSSENEHLSTNVSTAKILWLRELLNVIESGGDIDVEQTDKLLESWLGELGSISMEKREFIDDLEKRIMINTQNLFYFLHKKDYAEMLPLYSSLLGIYKLTLLLNNVMTVEFANQAIENLKIDKLSQLLRKESFLEFLKQEISFAKREQEYTFTLAYLDLDNFKSVNDKYGHYSGDKVIEKFGTIIKNSIRGSDIAFRIGGDEFAIIFKSASKSAAAKVCQKIGMEFGEHSFVFNDETHFKVGTSMGVVEFNAQMMPDCESMIKQVDAKLYEAKNAGKNRISF